MTPESLVPERGSRWDRWPALPRWLALAVLGAGLIFTVWRWRQDQLGAQRETVAYFTFRARDAAERITARLSTYEQVLRGARGLFMASESVDRREFSEYVAALRLDEHYPGIQGVGYAHLIPAARLAAHEAEIRRQGFPAYAVRPPGPRDPYSSIIYLEPFADRNLRAFGYDMYSEPVRHAAMERAMVTGDVALSGRVVLVQETDKDVQQGFLVYLPIYRNGLAHDSPVARQQNLVGWVYAPFRMNDFMAGVLGERADDLDIEIFDGSSTAPADRLYDGQPGVKAAALPLTSTQVLSVGGHAWTVVVRAMPTLGARLRADDSHLVLVWGGLGSLLLASLVWLQALARERALALAESRRFQVEAERLHLQGAVGVMAKGLAHDLNNLLQSMLAWVEVARAKAGPGTPVAEALAHIDAGSALARELSERLKLLGDARDHLDTEGPVRPVIKEAVAEALAGSAVAVTYDLPPEEVRLRFNQGHLRQAFGHLAANAREALPAGNLLRLPPGDYLHLAFADTGRGIAPELLPLIFDPYFSTKERFSQKGLGLGLALSRIILQHHGGAIEAESEPGRGAAFHVYLPVAD